MAAQSLRKQYVLCLSFNIFNAWLSILLQPAIRICIARSARYDKFLLFKYFIQVGVDHLWCTGYLPGERHRQIVEHSEMHQTHTHTHFQSTLSPGSSSFLRPCSSRFPPADGKILATYFTSKFHSSSCDTPPRNHPSLISLKHDSR